MKENPVIGAFYGAELATKDRQLAAASPLQAAGKRLAPAALGSAAAGTRTVVGLFAALLVGALLIYFTPINSNSITFSSLLSALTAGVTAPTILDLHCRNITCPASATNLTCPPPPLPPPPTRIARSVETCPDYFRWIHDDLDRWKPTGITREMVEAARPHAHFRLVVRDGRVYLKRYSKSFQTRDVFTVWGILQLLRRYPGRVPDLDMMFNCNDSPAIMAAQYQPPKVAPPLFRYCGDDASVQIVFPDWSYWGWPEINVKPWEQLMTEIEEGNRRTNWTEREPYAFWKGNPSVSSSRLELLQCNASRMAHSNLHMFAQNWDKEAKHGFQSSNLADQCTYRYKVYIEGRSWSVSEKYILACDSPTLLVTPRFHDFFTRGLVPMTHYWPVNAAHKCRSIKFAVDWGNSHPDQAQEIGRQGSGFVREKLDMGHVYDYMLHLLTHYAGLMRYRPEVPPGAEEVCAQSIACGSTGRQREFIMSSLVNASSAHGPCLLQPPMNRFEKEALANSTAERVKKVDEWERISQQASQGR